MAKSENVEVLVIDWLKTWVGNDWPVSSEKKKTPPEKYILVERTGGPRESMVMDRAEILIEVYHKTSKLDASNKANAIGDRVRELLEYNDDITRASVNSTVPLDDPIAQYRRYQVYVDVNHRR